MPAAIPHPEPQKDITVNAAIKPIQMMRENRVSADNMLQY